MEETLEKMGAAADDIRGHDHAGSIESQVAEALYSTGELKKVGMQTLPANPKPP